MKKVLVLEDDFDTRILMEECLNSIGYLPHSSENGLDALEHIRQDGLPDLIIMDLTLPMMTPENFMSEFRNIPGAAVVPVLVISGKSEIAEICESLKATSYLMKPIDLDKLISKLDELL